jgi:hypothetical protein
VRTLWCWRCKADVPMLDEEEYTQVAEVYHQCLLHAKEFRRTEGVPVQDPGIAQRMRPVCLRYEEITGMRENNANAILHHRLSRYGPPCTRCGKPLRTPSAKLCVACMPPCYKQVTN